MKKIMLIMILSLISLPSAFAGVKEKIYVVPNATAGLINKAAQGTNENLTSLVGGANNTAHNIANDLNEFGKSIYRGLFGGEVE